MKFNMPKTPFRVAVFGSSLPKPGDPAYTEALTLGKLLGENGYLVLTGGYVGTMEAVSCGAAQQGAHVIGVTCDEIEKFRPVGPNPWVKEEMRFPTLRSRLMGIIDACDAALVLPGGIGTLAEMTMMWNHLLVGAISPRPLVLIGAGWSRIIDLLFTTMNEYIPIDQRAWISLAEDIYTAQQQLLLWQQNKASIGNSQERLE